MALRSITEAGSLRGSYVLLRASLNLPLEDGVVRNRFRLERALPTLRYLHECGARTIVIAHLGRDPKDTLQPVYDELDKHLPVQWGGAITAEGFRQRRELMSDGDLLLAENLRQDPRETANDPEFVRLLAGYADVYVNDAFAVAHREHASTYGLIDALPAYAGLTMTEEVHELTRALDPTPPSLFLLGGAKFETKLPLIEKFLSLYDHVFVGGALANDVLLARGYEVGQSLTSDVSLAGRPFLDNPKLLSPIDVMVDGPDGRHSKPPEAVTPEERILDCGPLTTDMLVTYIETAQTILWNGPFGAYELGYTESTEKTAKHIAEAAATSILGGGDTVAAIEKLALNDQFHFVSTGGGSMLKVLETGTTPVLEKLRTQ